MLSITYDAIFSRFLAQVQAYDLAIVDEIEARQKLNEWLMSIRSVPRVRKTLASVSFDKNIEVVFCEVKNSLGNDEDDTDFVINMFSLGVAWKWSTEKYNSVLNTAQYFGSGEKKMFSQSNHMDKLGEMSKATKHELYDFIMSHGTYNNTYLNGEGT